MSGPSLHNSWGIYRYNYGQESMEIPCGDVYNMDIGNGNLWTQMFMCCLYITICLFVGYIFRPFVESFFCDMVASFF